MSLQVASSLITIGKTIIDSIKTTKDIFKKDKSSEEAVKKLAEINKKFNSYTDRIELLATQIYQCETLSRFIPMWLVHHNKFNEIDDKPNLKELKMLDSDLRSFIIHSIKDQFASAFFQTNYNKLPEIEKMIQAFRKRINDIDKDLAAIPRGKIDMLKLSWKTTIKSDLSRLQRDALDIERKANSIFEKVVNELKEVASYEKERNN